MLAGQSGAAQDVGPGARLTGTWARPVIQAVRIWLAEGQLPELIRSLKRVEKRLQALEALAAKSAGARQ